MKLPSLATAPNKFYAAFTGVVATAALIVKNGVGVVSNEEWYALIISVWVACAVFFVSNPETGDPDA
jgi:predicted small integral membrane protein